MNNPHDTRPTSIDGMRPRIDPHASQTTAGSSNCRTASGSNDASLADATKALLMLRAEMSQREDRMRTAIDRHVQELGQDLHRARLDIVASVKNASAQIASDARKVTVSASADLQREATASARRLRHVSRLAWIWLGGAMMLLLMTLLVGWAVLGYYQRELRSAKVALSRHENAIPVMHAFDASDAVICDGRICINPEPSAEARGVGKQYRRAQDRP